METIFYSRNVERKPCCFLEGLSGNPVFKKLSGNPVFGLVEFKPCCFYKKVERKPCCFVEGLSGNPVVCRKVEWKPCF